MKKFLVLVSLLTVSQTVHATSAKDLLWMTVAPTIGTVWASSITSGNGWCKEARQIIQDGQEFNLTGELTPYLNEKVNLIQELEAELSTEEAVDVLIETALANLN